MTSLKSGQLHKKEQRKLLLEQLQKEEEKINHKWLSSSADVQLVCNNSGYFGNRSIYRCCFLKTLRDFLISIVTCGGFLFHKLRQIRRDRRFISTLNELKELSTRKRELGKVQNYFQEIEESERKYKNISEKEIEPWALKIIENSLSVLPYNQYEDILMRKKDNYLKFLHYYACFISIVLTCGLILFYILFRKMINPKYKFLETALTKHVIESSKFEDYLKELLTKTVGFDSLDNISYCYTKSFGDTAFNSQLTTNVFKKPILRIGFFITLTLLTAGIFPLFVYWNSVNFSKEKFYKWWDKRKKEEAQQLEPIGNISRKWWGRGVKTLRKLWIDFSLLTYLSEITSRTISSTFLKSPSKTKNLNWTMFWMFTSPLGKWIINLLLLILTYAFLMVWSFQFQWGFASNVWPMYIVFISGSLFLFLLGYHLYLII